MSATLEALNEWLGRESGTRRIWWTDLSAELVLSKLSEIR